MNFSNYVIPAIIAIVFTAGLIKKVDVFAVFLDGVKDGAKTITEIFPALFCLMLAVGVVKSSGAAAMFADLLAPITNLIGFPKEVLPLAVLRPFSGSGSIAVYEGILKDNGADSFASRVASAIIGSSETTFYTLAVYFAATKVKKTRYALPAALCGDFAVFVLGVLFVRMTLG
ncbi:MAG: spore maturation protein [Oscillospiraceae bacterium]|jgi:spore maturation protein B|nr:spore maturation protein [Oscillospiraceae bacterium]